VAKVLNDQEVLIEVSDKIFVKFVKSTIASVVNPTDSVPAAAEQSPIEGKTEPKVAEAPNVTQSPLQQKKPADKRRNIGQKPANKPKK
jgi:hypothetical protein